MTTRRTGFLAAILLLLVALLGAAIWLVLRDDEPAADQPDAPDASVEVTTPERPPRASTETTRTPREHVVATPEERDTGSPHENTTFPEPTHSPIAPTRTVRVTVVHEGGVPVRDARVTAFSAFGVVRVDPQDATTDIEGKATLTVTGTASFRVRAWTRDAAAIGERITVDPDASVDVTLTLEPARAVAGRVISDSSLAVTNARVIVRLHSRDPFGLSLSTGTDADGRFELGALPTRALDGAGTRVVAAARGYTKLDAPFADLASTWDDLVLRLERGLLVHGRCVATGAAPVQNVRVQAHGFSGLVMTERDGTFELDGVSPAGAEIELFPPEHVVPPPITLRAGVGEVDLGDVLLTDGLPISGVVVDDQEQAVVGASVHAYEQERSREVRSTSTDAQGRFTLPHIGEGPHTIVAVPTQGGEWSSRVSGRATDVTAGTSGVRIVLSGGLTLLVEFKQESDREPVEVASAEVEVTRLDVESGRTVSAWAGPGMSSVRVTFEQAGRYQVVVKVPGYEPATLDDVEILDDRPTRIEALFRETPR